MRYERGGIAIFSLILFIGGSFYFDTASVFLSTLAPSSEISKFIINSVIGLSTGTVSAAVAWKGLGYQRKRYERDENRKEAEVRIERWYPKGDDIRICLSNLGEDRVKNLGILVLAKPLRHYVAPLSSSNADFNPEMKSRPSPLRRVDNQVGTNPANYLEKEKNVFFETSVWVQMVDEELRGPMSVPYRFPTFLEDLPNEVKAATFKVILVYENIHGDEMKSEEVFSFTSSLDYPDRIAQREAKAPEMTEFGTRIVPFPEKFEELFKTPYFNPHQGERPATGFAFFSIDSDEFEEGEDD
jgi:hypothetical protein